MSKISKFGSKPFKWLLRGDLIRLQYKHVSVLIWDDLMWNAELNFFELAPDPTKRILVLIDTTNACFKILWLKNLTVFILAV